MPNWVLISVVFQAVPFPDDKKQEAKDSFMECAEGESLNLDEIPKHSDLKQVQGQGNTGNLPVNRVRVR